MPRPDAKVAQQGFSGSFETLEKRSCVPGPDVKAEESCVPGPEGKVAQRGFCGCKRMRFTMAVEPAGKVGKRKASSVAQEESDLKRP